MDEAIIRYVRRKHQLLIGEANAERIKIEVGSALLDATVAEAEVHIRGRDLRQGRPKSAILGPHDVAEALQDPMEELAEFIQRAIEELPPEVSTDIFERGVHMTGGGALLRHIDKELERRVGVKFIIPARPMHCVIEGTAEVLETLSEREYLLIKP